jgi:hypothetical protein
VAAAVIRLSATVSAALIAAFGLAASLPATTVAPATLTATLKETPTIGQEGRGFKLMFTMTFGGQPVRRLPAGTYRLVVNDQSRILNFHLVGPGGTDVRSTAGKRVVTGVEAKATVTFLVRLRKGTYAYYSDPHAWTIRKTFRVL